MFDNGKGQSTTLDPATVANVFRAINHARPVTRCVLLNGCFSEPVAAELRPAVDVVVGTTDRISDPGAIAFARGFYARLAELLAAAPPAPDDQTFPAAIEAGRAQVRLLPPAPGASRGEADLIVTYLRDR